MMPERIDVNQPFLPPIEEYQSYVADIWDKKWLTNNGALLQELEQKLSGYLQVENIAAVSNGTVALQIAISSLNLSGAIITTPYSYVATSSAVSWQQCRPVFVDIDAKTMNIDPALIEDAITDDTQAILATHVFGTPCDVVEIGRIAKKHNLKVIYDAAHSFGCKFRGKSVFEYGDVSCVSFHATKVFHCTEGGAVITKNTEIHKRIKSKRNFGHDGPYRFSEVGINGKQSEFHAAMGLCNLRYIDSIITKRRLDSFKYFELLDGLPVSYPIVPEESELNYAYFPIVFETEERCVDVLKALQEHEIFCRRYFYPALSSLDIFEKKHCPIAESVSSRVLCLPLYYDLKTSQIELISSVIKSVF